MNLVKEKNSLYENLQKSIVDKDLVCSLELEAVTPVWIGGYDTRTLHKNSGTGLDLGSEGLRPSSVKGVWRWWARSLVSAAIYKRTGKFPTIRIADELISEFLGSTKCSSHYQLVIDSHEYSHELQYGDITLSRNVTIRGILSAGNKFLLRLYRRTQTESDQDAFAVYSLVLALVLGGIGRATTRGFGKFLVKCTGKNSCVEVLRETCMKLHNLYTRGDIKSDEVEKIVRELLERGVELAENILKNKELKLDKLHEKPLFETPVNGYYQIIVSPRISDTRGTGEDILQKVRYIINRVDMNEKLRNEHKLILGLPRPKIETREKSLRRKSPIIFTPIKLLGEGSYYILVLGFKTYDWEEKRFKINVDEIDVDTAFMNVMNNIKNNLEISGESNEKAAR